MTRTRTHTLLIKNTRAFFSFCVLFLLNFWREFCFKRSPGDEADILRILVSICCSSALSSTLSLLGLEMTMGSMELLREGFVCSASLLLFDTAAWVDGDNSNEWLRLWCFHQRDRFSVGCSPGIADFSWWLVVGAKICLINGPSFLATVTAENISKWKNQLIYLFIIYFMYPFLC